MTVPTIAHLLHSSVCENIYTLDTSSNIDINTVYTHFYTQLNNNTVFAYISRTKQAQKQQQQLTLLESRQKQEREKLDRENANRTVYTVGNPILYNHIASLWNGIDQNEGLCRCILLNGLPGTGVCTQSMLISEQFDILHIDIHTLYSNELLTKSIRSVSIANAMEVCVCTCINAHIHAHAHTCTYPQN